MLILQKIWILALKTADYKTEKISFPIFFWNHTFLIWSMITADPKAGGSAKKNLEILYVPVPVFHRWRDFSFLTLCLGTYCRGKTEKGCLPCSIFDSFFFFFSERAKKNWRRERHNWRGQKNMMGRQEERLIPSPKIIKDITRKGLAWIWSSCTCMMGKPAIEMAAVHLNYLSVLALTSLSVLYLSSLDRSLIITLLFCHCMHESETFKIWWFVPSKF